MYDFKQLSSADFEELTRDLLQEHWGVYLESFKAGRDKGIDLRYTTSAKKNTIIQCKHYVGSGLTKLVYELTKTELRKVAQLHPARYILVTSLPLSPGDKEQIQNSLHPYIKRLSDVYGAEDLNNLLGKYPKIENKHFKLWLSSVSVLQRVLRNAESVTTDFHLERIINNIPLYVQNANYPTALEMLEKNKILIISGIPGIGKTTLADMLLFAHVEKNFEPVVIHSDIRDGKASFKKEGRQIFYFDDFLGATFLGNRFDFVGKREDSSILDFLEMVAKSKNSRMILTTREHILRHAFQVSEIFSRGKEELAAQKFILELGSYSLMDKAKILFNHLYFSDLPSAYKNKLLEGSFYMRLLSHKNFNPRLVKSLSTYTNVKSHKVTEYQSRVMAIFNDPSDLWRIAFDKQISEASKSLLLVLYSFGGRSPISKLDFAWKKLHEYRSNNYNFSTSAGDFRNSLQDLEGGFIVLEKTYFSEIEVAFVNPSVKDFFDSMLVKHHSYWYDLISAAAFFPQVATLWNFAASEKGGEIRQRVIDHPAQFINKVEAKLLTPEVPRDLEIDGNVVLESRLHFLVQLYKYINSPALDAVFATYAERLIAHLEKNYSRTEDLISLCRVLNASNSKALVELDYFDKFKDILIEEISNQLDMPTILSIIEFVRGEHVFLQEEELELLKDTLGEIVSSDIDSYLRDVESENECDELHSRLDSAADFLRVDLSDELGAIAEKVEELRQPDHNDDDSSPTWRGQTTPTEATSSGISEAAAIRDLFDGLRTDEE